MPRRALYMIPVLASAIGALCVLVAADPEGSVSLEAAPAAPPSRPAPETLPVGPDAPLPRSAPPADQRPRDRRPRSDERPAPTPRRRPGAGSRDPVDPWNPAHLGRVGQAFLYPPDRDSWEVAFWYLRRSPDPLVIAWFGDFLASAAPLDDRVDVLLVLAERPEPMAQHLLEQQLESHEPTLEIAARQALHHRASLASSGRSTHLNGGGTR